ncbi:MAG: dynamin family protein [Pseudomonadota bacterium]
MNDMSAKPDLPFFTETGGPRRPRIALMGEFSAGKSTLANLMIGSDPLPVQVIATQLPPVWIQFGDGPAVIVDLEGNETPFSVDSLRAGRDEETAYIRIFARENILRICDIIDMPGISDPNMSPTVWERVMPLADGVVWCTPATQAWRQSEAAVWEAVSDEVREHSILLLTRADMLLTPRDKRKVLKRVQTETHGLFAACIPISLLLAQEAGDDLDLWDESGAEPFVTTFLRVIGQLKDHLGTDALADGMPHMQLVAVEPTEVASDLEPETAPVVPRRPVAGGKGQRRGHPAQDAES